MKTMTISTPKSQTENYEKISKFRGMNLQADATLIDYNSASDMLNMQLDSVGTLQRFLGYTRAFPTELGSNKPCYGLFYNPKIGKMIFSNNGTLYTFSDSVNPSVLYNGIALADMQSFFMNNTQYFFDGTNFLQFDGSCVAPNLLGTDGDCEDTSKWSFVQATLSLDSTNKVFGNNSLKVLIASSTRCNANQNIFSKLDPSKYYSLSAYIKNGNSSSVILYLYSNGAGRVLKSSATSDSTKFNRLTVKLQPSDWGIGSTNLLAEIDVDGVVNQYAYVDGIMINEITQNEYNDSTYTPPPFTTVTTPITTVESNAYIPTLTMGRTPTGGGSVFEAFNLLQPKFKDSFSATTATAYTLSLSGLDATQVTATLNGVAKVENTDFTVNRTTGVVTFSVAPTAGTNNLVITASKTIATNPNKIKNCTLFTVFGGSNDTRVFLSGNPNYKNWDFRSGLLDPSYFPDTGFTKIGSDVTAIKGYSKLYDTLNIHKEDSNEDSTIYTRSYQLNSDGTVLFPVIQGNSGVGLYATKSIKTVEDSPLFLSKKGVYRYTGGSVKAQNSMQRISDYLEPNILNEANSDSAVSFTYDGKYGLSFSSGNTYVFDYRNKFTDTDGITKYEGYMWNGIYAKNFLEVNNILYFCDSAKGLVYKFLKPTDLIQYQNDGQAFQSYWYGKIFSFDADNYKKLVERVDFTLSPTTSRNSAELWIKTNKKEEFLVKEYRLITFDFNNIDFDDFDFQLSSFSQPFGKKVKAKKIIYFQPIFKNSKINEAMTINNTTLQYLLQSPIR